MENPERYLRFVREAERLKDTLRSAHTSQGRHESTAEHSWRLALLALALAGERPGLDSERVLGMCLIHDLGAKAATERSAVDRLTALLPEAAARRIHSLWEEYEECRTPEARWVKALDKAETILQHNQGANPEGFDYAFNLGYGAAWFGGDALLSELRRLLDEETARHIPPAR